MGKGGHTHLDGSLGLIHGHLVGGFHHLPWLREAERITMLNEGLCLNTFYTSVTLVRSAAAR